MPFKLVSFDLQGTLSDSSFSDEFWLNLLPHLYAEYHNIEFKNAKTILKQEFAEIGKYDLRYYSVEYWLGRLCPASSFQQIIQRLETSPYLYDDTLSFVKELHGVVPLIVVSTTTRRFIELELGGESRYFEHTYSSLDDLEIPGKPPEVFRKVAEKLGVEPAQILHVGDCEEMDVKNAKEAGWQAFHFEKGRTRAELVDALRELISLPDKA